MVAKEPTSKRRRMIVLGSLLIVAGVVAAVVTWIAADSRRTGAVENLARAPIGCDTTLDFAASGEYFLFVETTGRFDEVRGDCDAQGTYELTDGRPDVDITILDPDGAQLELRSRSDDVTYSTDDFAGRSVFAVDVSDAGDHVMRVESEDSTAFAVAVGRDPNSGVGLLRTAGLAAGLAGVVVGLILALFVGKSKQSVAAGWTPGQPGQAQWAPGQPPFAQPSQPPYAQPGAGPPPGPGSPPVYGGYGQEGHYGQPPAQRPPAMPSSAPVSQPSPPTARGPQLPAAPTAPGSWSPSAPSSAPNPFAPPVGTRQNAPSGSVAPIPGQPAPSAATGDGALGWPPGAPSGSAPSADDEATPPRGTPATRVSEASNDPAASPTEFDKWDTSRNEPPS